MSKKPRTWVFIIRLHIYSKGFFMYKKTIESMVFKEWNIRCNWIQHHFTVHNNIPAGRSVVALSREDEGLAGSRLPWEDEDWLWRTCPTRRVMSPVPASRARQIPVAATPNCLGPIPKIGNSHTSASPRPTTLEEDWELFVDFPSIWVSNTASCGFISFYVNPPSYSYDRAFSKFDLQNPRSKS